MSNVLSSVIGWQELFVKQVSTGRAFGLQWTFETRPDSYTREAILCITATIGRTSRSEMLDIDGTFLGLGSTDKDWKGLVSKYVTDRMDRLAVVCVIDASRQPPSAMAWPSDKPDKNTAPQFWSDVAPSRRRPTKQDLATERNIDGSFEPPVAMNVRTWVSPAVAKKPLTPAVSNDREISFED